MVCLRCLHAASVVVVGKQSFNHAHEQPERIFFMEVHQSDGSDHIKTLAVPSLRVMPKENRIGVKIDIGQRLGGVISHVTGNLWHSPGDMSQTEVHTRMHYVRLPGFLATVGVQVPE